MAKTSPASQRPEVDKVGVGTVFTVIAINEKDVASARFSATCLFCRHVCRDGYRRISDEHLQPTGKHGLFRFREVVLEG